MHCKNCGKLNENKNQYCLYCGADLGNYPFSGISRVECQQQIFCGYCGKPNRPGDNYCQSCGQGLETLDAVSEDETPINQELKNLGLKIKSLNIKDIIQVLGKGSWLDAFTGAAAAAVTGIMIFFLSLKIISFVLINMAQNDRDAIQVIKQGFNLINPLSVWVFSHLPNIYLSVGGSMSRMQLEAKSYIHLPLLFMLLVPLFALFIGNLVASRRLDSKDWVSRGVQGFRVGIIYAGILLILSFFTGGEIKIPTLVKQLLGSNFLGLSISAGFERLNIFINGLILGSVFGVITSVRSRLTLFVQDLLGEHKASMFSGIWQSLMISVAGGLVLNLIGFIYVLSNNGIPRNSDGWMTVVAFILFLPNLIIYELCLGGGASLKISSSLPSQDLPNLTVSLLGVAQNGVKQHIGFEWVVFVFLVLVLVSLFWGGYKVQRSNPQDLLKNSLVVAGGYSLVLSILAWLSQFRAQVDSGSLNSLMQLLNLKSGKIEIFGGASFWATLLCVLIVGFIGSVLGAFISSKAHGNHTHTDGQMSC